MLNEKNSKLFNQQKPITLVAVLSFSLLVFFLPSSIFAQEAETGLRQGAMGGLDLELDDKPHKNPYETTQDNTIQFFDVFQKELSGGGIPQAENLETEQLQFLTAVYLYCAKKKGVCPFIPEALYAVDLVQAIQSKKHTCPNLTTFWKLWVRNDMEKRHKFEVRVTQVQQVEKFNREVRPKYIKCKNTITREFKNISGTPSSYLRQKYSPGSPAAEALEQMVFFLKFLKENVNNVYIATGAKRPK